MLKITRLLNKLALITIIVNTNTVINGNNLKLILHKSKKPKMIKFKKLVKSKNRTNLSEF